MVERGGKVFDSFLEDFRKAHGRNIDNVWGFLNELIKLA